jgi:hypothetical protein
MHNQWTIRLSGDIPDGRLMRTIEDANQPGLPFYGPRNSPVAISAQVAAD